jgi:hypothetical protein
MSNTVSILSYANTFGDWVVTTNALAKENNDLAANNYTKPSGTLYLNDPSLGLSVLTSAFVQGQLQAGSASVYGSLTVGTQAYFSNTLLSIATLGQANIGGPILALSSNTGLAVSNNANIGGILTVTGQAALNNNLVVLQTTTANNITSNNITTSNTTTTNILNVTGSFNANSVTGSFQNLQVGNQLTVGGNFVINGTTVYNSNNFTINAGSNVALNSTFTVNRGGSGTNALIRWNETGGKYWDTVDVTNNTYSRLLTSSLLTDSYSVANSQLAISATAGYNLNTAINTANTFLQNYAYNVGGLVAQAAYAQANTGANSFVGTTGAVSPTNGSITFKSNNGVTIVGSGNTITINDAQDIRTTATPTFNGLALSSALPIIYGGTGTTSAAAALTALLPTGTTAGYTLTTGGPGSFYWAASGSGGGGGGTTPGTTINSSRTFPTVNVGQTVFTTPTYTPGASQLRVYRDGVRQFNSDYTETSNTSVTLNDATASGETLMLEVDGFIINPYYANNIPYTINSTISSTANTIQLAIDGLASIVAFSANAALTGISTAPTPAANGSNTQIATTAFVKNVLNSGNTFSMNISGSATNISGFTINQNLGTTSNVQFSSIGVGTTPDSANTGSIRAINNITAYYSDDRLKTNLGNIESALDKLMTLDGFYYEANQTAQDLGYKPVREVGLSAQQVQKVLPEVIATAPIDDKYLTIHYERVIPLIVEAMKELKREIDLLKGQ